MFVALHQKEKLIHMLHKNWTREELRELEKIDSFRCPNCHEKVTLKLGMKQIWHFAHKVDSLCLLNERSGESEEHKKAKEVLGGWLKHEGCMSEIEKYFPTSKQRADVFSVIAQRRIAFELQRSSLTSQLMIKRSANYERMHVEPIWIGFQSSFPETKTIQFPRHNLHQSLIKVTPQLYSLYIDPFKKSWLVLTKFRYFNGKKMIAKPTTLPLTTKPLHLIDLSHTVAKAVNLETKLDADYLNLWKKEVEKKRIKKYLSLSRTESFMLKLFLRYQLNLNYFPALSSLPLKGNFLFDTSPVWWQSHILLHTLNNLPLNSNIRISKMIHVYLPYVMNNTFPMVNIAVHPKEMLRKVFIEFLDALCNFEVLKKSRPGVYILLNHITWNKSLETLFHDDTFVQDRMESIFQNTEEIYFENENIFVK
ncbi:competence protein CoiA [Evansella halocellulosilytica]|uniref:competence protein CoiA n=1 Tax=Evansella halocellulosilytica TaxID=2011013 RepID=UPI000BB842F1|nr:competence protein CoiA family protein [Evansella halocellulosilytica]